MIYSMTGYAAASRDLGSAVMSLEIKSVNSRYLDIGFRLSEDLRFLEMPLREKIAERIGRGKIECRGYLLAQPAQGAVARERVPNPALLAELGKLDDAVRGVLPQAAPLSVAEVLRWPGVLGDDSLSGETLQVAAQELFAALLDEFVASREREGAKLADVLKDRAARHPHGRTRARTEEGRRGRQAAGFPHAGTQPRGQYPGLEIGLRRSHGHRAGTQAADRADARAGAEPGIVGAGGTATRLALSRV